MNKAKAFVEYLEVKTQVSECLKEYYCNEDVIFGISDCGAINDGSSSDDISYADAASSKAIIGEAIAVMLIVQMVSSMTVKLIALMLPVLIKIKIV